MDKEEKPIALEGVNPGHLYTLDTLAALLGLTKRRLQEALAKGEMKGHKKHRRWYVLGSQAIDYITKD